MNSSGAPAPTAGQPETPPIDQCRTKSPILVANMDAQPATGPTERLGTLASSARTVLNYVGNARARPDFALCVPFVRVFGRETHQTGTLDPDCAWKDTAVVNFGKPC
jgi:hypothetical protein